MITKCKEKEANLAFGKVRVFWKLNWFNMKIGLDWFNKNFKIWSTLFTNIELHWRESRTYFYNFIEDIEPFFKWVLIMNEAAIDF